jgi:hypothetical protein
MEVVKGQFSLMECHALVVKTDYWNALIAVYRSIAATITTMLEWSVCQAVILVKSDLLVELTILKVVWRSASTMNGGQCVIKCGMELMLVLSVGN